MLSDVGNVGANVVVNNSLGIIVVVKFSSSSPIDPSDFKSKTVRCGNRAFELLLRLPLGMQEQS